MDWTAFFWGLVIGTIFGACVGFCVAGLFHINESSN